MCVKSLLLLAPLLAACAQPTTPPEQYEYTLAPATQWSGGSVTIRSGFFRGRTSLPAVIAGADTVLLRRIDDSTVAFTLPIGPSGSTHLLLATGHGPEAIGAVGRVGQASRVDISPVPQVALVAATHGTGPVYIGAQYNQSVNEFEVVEVDPVSGTSVLHSGLYTPNGYYGAGISYRADRFLLEDATDSLKVWQLWPGPQPVAVAPFGQGTPVRLAAQLTDSTWLVSYNHWTDTYGPVPVSHLPAEDPWTLFYSPRGDRLAMSNVATSLPGSPVFDTRTGDTAFTITGVRAVQWADFGADGSTLYVLGAYYYQVPLGDSIYVLDATSGQRVRAPVAMPDSFTALTMARDPVQDLLFVQGYRTCGPSILVYQASSFAQVGELKGEGSVEDCFNASWSGMMTVDRVRQKLYLLWVGGQGPAPLWTFDLMP